jgi:hypothetical protein
MEIGIPAVKGLSLENLEFIVPQIGLVANSDAMYAGSIVLSSRRASIAFDPQPIWINSHSTLSDPSERDSNFIELRVLDTEIDLPVTQMFRHATPYDS